MNNEMIRNYYNGFARIGGFAKKYGDRFAAGSRATTLFAGLGLVVKAMEGNGVAQISGTEEYRGGTDAKVAAAVLVREDLRAIRDTAESIAEAEDTPDFDDQFVMPRSSAYGVLLTRARAFLKDATPYKALFIEFEMAADFLEDLEADIALLEKAAETQGEGLSGQVGGTAELTAEVEKGSKLRKQLLSIVRNKFRDDAGILAEWETAAHIVRPQRKPAKEQPAPVA